MMLYFRCVNKSCPGNYCITVLNKSLSEKMAKGGIDIFGQHGKCMLCGSQALAYQIPIGTNRKQKAQYFSQIEDAIDKLRKATELMQKLAKKEKKNVDMAQ